MIIQIVEFYPIIIKKESLSGTIKIYIPQLMVTLNGIYCLKNNTKWYFNLPGHKGFDPIKKQICRYTYFYYDGEIQKEIVYAVKESAPSFIEQRINDKTKPLIFMPEIPKKEQKKISKPTVKSVLTTKWCEPPKRKEFYGKKKVI